MIALRVHPTTLGVLLRQGAHNHHLVTCGVPSDMGLVGMEGDTGDAYLRMYFAGFGEEDTPEARKEAEQITLEFKQLVRQDVQPQLHAPVVNNTRNQYWEFA